MASSTSASTASTDASNDISSPLFAAVYDYVVPDRLLFAPHRRYLTADLDGRVLDVGAGTGTNFPYVAATDESVEFHAIEPDPHMRRQAETRAAETDCAVDLRDARAESMPYPDDAFDAVLASLVFCTIHDPDVALDEVARVLAPGGEFRFVEHVRNDGWRATGQNVLNPLWKRLAGGCQLNRDTIERFVSNDAFAVETIERLDAGIFPATPMVRGTMRRRR
ncbi:class I SAM-dependent methyltransferase [Natrialba asiatica]|uniref:Type 11 methyltransferase n=1 Tax=Natrialba asiatica (strain ATCC 700177 / DSM 12278 / JCM 9576 / FERM P-10747 / NBRC 102637 / 172P1) TaxID=29540 RepID=M0AUZ2_NATA1|nr:class I SAM-dependent methyltransferase [Natrialba asiatica]ELZ02501.1 type 11 methyltransferase [Natrialba asiatica DSM 12278]